MADASSFQDRYHVQFGKRRTTITLDKILSQLLALHLAKLTPDHPDYHKTVQQWLQETLTDKMGENVPSGNSISQHARQYAIETIAKPRLMNSLWEWRLRDS